MSLECRFKFRSAARRLGCRHGGRQTYALPGSDPNTPFLVTAERSVELEQSATAQAFGATRACRADCQRGATAVVVTPPLPPGSRPVCTRLHPLWAWASGLHPLRAWASGLHPLWAWVSGLHPLGAWARSLPSGGTPARRRAGAHVPKRGKPVDSSPRPSPLRRDR